MAKLKELKDFFVDELKDIYSAEKQLTKALPKMAKNSNSEELKAAFEDHLKETEVHVSRLEKIGKILGKPLTGKKCKAMEGLIEESKELLEEDAAPEVLDVALICAAQKVEHYEIATYGCLKTYARLLGESEIAEILNETEQEEGNADKKLTAIADALNEDSIQPIEKEVA